MKLASIETIKTIEKHPNADALDIATVLGYRCIVARDSFSPGEKIVLIQPDTVLPDEPWAEMFRKRSNRVKACRLRGEWSFGIVMPISTWPALVAYGDIVAGTEVSEIIGVTKYEPPAPQDLSAAGYLPRGLPKTDEERWQNIEALPYGEVCDITLKIDGCLTGDTMIITDRGELSIQRIVEENMVGIKVLTYNTEQNIEEYQPVLATTASVDESKQWYEVELECGTILTLTGNHRVWLPELNCYRRADKLLEEDVLMILN